MSVSGIAVLSLALLMAGVLPTEAQSVQEAQGVQVVERWLALGMEHRSRVESLRPDFRGEQPNTNVYVMRTILEAGVFFHKLSLHAELADSRAYLAADETSLGTANVNTFSLLSAHLRYVHWLGAWLAQARAGRLTLDVGSRRLVARNRFRNTINGFTGFDLSVTRVPQHEFRVFALIPVTRRPSDADSIESNAYEPDKENTDAVFVGALHSIDEDNWPLIAPFGIEAYALHLREGDGEVQTSNRKLTTLGGRLFRNKARGRWDLELELALQFGSSRATSNAADTADLDHLAYFGHAEAGFTLDHARTPRILLQYDYASGDSNPLDGENQRFDTLFGARRFEFGPTGIYGPFARSNLNSPGMRLEIEAHEKISAFVGYRAHWLASATDAWTSAGLRDPGGASGKFLGHHVEGRLRYTVLAKTLLAEAGAAYLFRDRFALEAPGAGTDDSFYMYTQLTAEFDHTFYK